MIINDSKISLTFASETLVAHSLLLCRSATLWPSGGVGGRGSGLPGGSLLWQPVSGDQPAEQPGGEGVVLRPLRGAQEGEFLCGGEEAAGEGHAGVPGRFKKKELYFLSHLILCHIFNPSSFLLPPLGI